MSQMETIGEALARLRAAGFDLDLVATAGTRLRVAGRREKLEPAEMRIDEIVRFEGDSDPDDEAILFALRGPGDRRGVYVTVYGAHTPRIDVDVMRALGSAPGEHAARSS